MPLTAVALWWAFSERRLIEQLLSGAASAAAHAGSHGRASSHIASFASVTSFLHLEGAVGTSAGGPVAQDETLIVKTS